jgi:hypothetical protein
MPLQLYAFGGCLCQYQKSLVSLPNETAVLVQKFIAAFALYDLSGNPVCKGKTTGNGA